MRAWLVVDKGKIGSQNQCIGLAEALGASYVLKAIHVKTPWYYIPRIFWPSPEVVLQNAKGYFAPPYPDLIIASGRSSAKIAADLKKKAPQTKVIYLMNPQMDLTAFDYVIAPAHDQLKGPNVIESVGMLNRVTPDLLKSEGEKFTERFGGTTGIRVALLIGGNSKHYRMDDVTLHSLGKTLRAIHMRTPLYLMITFSRRTTPAQRQALLDAVQDIPHYIWDERPPNPYFAMLAHAQFVLVTQDSTSMVTEACTAGKSVYVIELKGKSAKFDFFYRQLAQQGRIQFFEGVLLATNNAPLTETQRIAKLLKKG